MCVHSCLRSLYVQETRASGVPVGTREYCVAVSVCMDISGRTEESGDVAVGRQLVCVLVCVCAYLHAACVSFLCTCVYV